MKNAWLVAVALVPIPAGAQTVAQLGLTCKNFVEQVLDDPRDAQLDGWSEAQAAQGKDGVWVVRFAGRARNQFGALRRVTFECRMRYTPPDQFRGSARIL
jgi:hypothetical protein